MNPKTYRRFKKDGRGSAKPTIESDSGCIRLTGMARFSSRLAELIKHDEKDSGSRIVTGSLSPFHSPEGLDGKFRVESDTMGEVHVPADRQALSFFSMI